LTDEATMRVRGFALLLSGIVVLSQTAVAVSPDQRRAKAALDSVIPSADFTNVTLQHAIDVLREQSLLSIHPNWKSLDKAGVEPATLVNLKLRNVRLREAMNAILVEASHGAAIAWYLEGDAIEVTTLERADAQMYTITYEVQEEPPTMLLGGSRSTAVHGYAAAREPMLRPKRPLNALQQEQLENDMIDLIRETIRPDVWVPDTSSSRSAHGPRGPAIRADEENPTGKATLRFFNGKLVVNAPRSVHQELVRVGR
jgi:hypothetical protein